jgi:hypothetical protein
MIPPDVMDECREKARMAMSEGKPTNWKAAGAIIAAWVLLALLVIVVMARLLRG